MDFATFYFTQVKNLRYCNTNLIWREWLRIEDENEDPWVPNQGAEKGQKWLKLTKVLNLFYFAPIQFT